MGGADVRNKRGLRNKNVGKFFYFARPVHAHFEYADLMMGPDIEYRKRQPRFRIQISPIHNNRIGLRKNRSDAFFYRRFSARTGNADFLQSGEFCHVKGGGFLQSVQGVFG